MRKINQFQTDLVYEKMKNYPILNTLFNECEQREVFTERTKFGDNYCQVVKGNYKLKYSIFEEYQFSRIANKFLKTMESMFTKNPIKAKDDEVDGRTYTKRIPTEDLDFLRENCILVSCGSDQIGQRKLRVSVDDFHNGGRILSDVAVCTKDEWIKAETQRLFELEKQLEQESNVGVV